MTRAELRQAKANIHYVLIDTVFSFKSTTEEEMQLWKYIIEQAQNELTRIELEECGLLL